MLPVQKLERDYVGNVTEWPSICKQQQFLHRFTHLHALWF